MVDPDTICFTAISIFLPFTVYYTIILKLAYPKAVRKLKYAYRDILDLKNEGRNMPRTPSLPNSRFDLPDQVIR